MNEIDIIITTMTVGFKVTWPGAYIASAIWSVQVVFARQLRDRHTRFTGARRQPDLEFNRKVGPPA